jgi:hypothetical protein
MSAAQQPEPSEQQLTRYLLGALSEEEAERLDQLSIADEEFALRLNVVENDLVDAYVRGELKGEAQDRFDKHYLRSPKRLEKVEFSRALLRHQTESPTAVSRRVRTEDDAPHVRSPQEESDARDGWRWLNVPRLGLRWGPAAAATVMLLTASFLFYENKGLRQEESETRDQQAALNRRAQELERQLREQRVANSGLAKELESLRTSLPASHALATIVAVLAPPTRGVGQIPSISLPTGTDQVLLRLQLEADEFPRYQVTLKDPATNRILWHTTDALRANSEGNVKVVSVSLSAKLFKPQSYILELSGLSAIGEPELVSSYPFRVLLE